MKKFISIILSLVLVLSLATVASAATITIDPQLPTGTTSTGETYKAYKIFDATYTGDDVGPNSAVSYTISSDSPFYPVIAAFKVGDVPVFKLDQINNTKVYNVKKLENYDAAALATALKAVITDTTPVAGSVSAPNDEGKYVIDNLDKGYYIITSTLGSKMIVDTLGSAEIDTKNEYPSLTKKIVSGTERVETITADRGATITFEVTVTIPATAVGAITVHDDAADTLTNITLATGTTNGITQATSSCTKCDAEFVIDAATVAAAAASTDKKVTFQYTATLAASAATAAAHKNEAWLTYAAFTSTKDSVSVYTYQVDVYKYTGEGDAKTGLAGAGFVLKNSAGKYYKNTDGIVSWVDSETDATEYTTAADKSYTITFAGLANGSYTLVEKTVPAGYNKANDQTITIADANMTGATQIEVLNSTGSELPSTGGIGTTIFYVVGCLLMTGAVVLLVTKRRMGNA